MSRATLSVRLLAVGATAAALALPTVGAAAGESGSSVSAAGTDAAPGSELHRDHAGWPTGGRWWSATAPTR